MLNFKKYLFSTFLVVSFSISIFAQEVEEVVVTATKKEESTQDIAISVEAFTADMLADEQIYDLSDLTEVVPGFGFGKGNWIWFSFFNAWYWFIWYWCCCCFIISN